MRSDTTFIFLCVPMAILGGIASLWLTFQMIDITGAELLAITFGGLAGTFLIGAITCAIVGVAELWDSD